MLSILLASGFHPDSFLNLRALATRVAGSPSRLGPVCVKTILPVIRYTLAIISLMLTPLPEPKLNSTDEPGAMPSVYRVDR
jgi:hypothetical protein